MRKLANVIRMALLPVLAVRAGWCAIRRWRRGRTTMASTIRPISGGSRLARYASVHDWVKTDPGSAMR